MEKAKILLVDDEPDIREFLCYNLKKEGFEVLSAQNGKEAIKLVIQEKPDLIIMDVMMPEMDGIEACEEIRKIPEFQNILIAFLTARGEDYSQIAGFEAGGDDYIAKPIKPKVLISRINALLKRRKLEKPKKKEKEEERKEIVIDREKYLVIINNKELNLPKKEFELLAMLESKPGRVFTREEIYDFVWGDDVVVGDRTIDVHIRKLREKIGEKHIVTIKGVGYKFVN
ncbi:MAG: response regulator transcription factor [Bacteroidales bacterium]|nr:response regulator transcription factor [Bacteroidales bacterium]